MPESVTIEALVLRAAHTQDSGDTYVHLFLRDKSVHLDGEFSLKEKATRFTDMPLAQGLDTVSVTVAFDEDRNVARLDDFRLLHPSVRLD